MGINACILSWFEDISNAGHFAGLSSVLELGPQDFFFSKEVLAGAADRRLTVLGRNDRVAAEAAFIADPASPYAERQARFYGLFGLESYASVDTYDDRATYRQDLNTASAAPRRFDVIVDCGTAEHVFNVANVFAYVHNSLEMGGVSVSVLPTFGDNTHGFYNIHPSVYFDIARVNGYEILDFRYIDNMSARAAERGGESLLSQKQFEEGLLSFNGCAALQEAISENFLDVLAGARSEGRLSQAHNSVDYCFVVMRKLADGPFRYPGQGVYLTEGGASAGLPPELDEPAASQSAAPEGMSDHLLDVLFGEEFREIWRLAQPFTMVSEERAFATYKACRHVAVHDIEGDFVECGVYRGGMAVLASEVFRRYSRRSRRIWLFDTFAGMTQPDTMDEDRSGVSAEVALSAEPDMCLATLEEVQANLRVAQDNFDQFTFVQGDVLETLGKPANLPSRIAVLRLDTDWYASTAKELAVLYPRMAEGGIGLVDDYGHWLGARRAVDEFVAAARPPIYLARTDSTGVEFVKPPAHGGLLRRLVSRIIG